MRCSGIARGGAVVIPKRAEADSWVEG